MGNCLNDLVRFASSEVYSLRDESDRSVANVEIQAGLLIQISGPANEAVAEQYHPHLRLFLEERGIPSGDISARLGFIEFGEHTFPKLEDCTEAFIAWSTQNSSPTVLPFQKHPTIREFLNVFARHGRAAKASTRKSVADLFTPQPPAWCLAASTKCGAIVQYPKFPTALLHLTRYGAIDAAARDDAFRTAIIDIAAVATREAECVFRPERRESHFYTRNVRGFARENRNARALQARTFNRLFPKSRGPRRQDCARTPPAT